MKINNNQTKNKIFIITLCGLTIVIFLLFFILLTRFGSFSLAILIFIFVFFSSFYIPYIKWINSPNSIIITDKNICFKFDNNSLLKENQIIFNWINIKNIIIKNKYSISIINHNNEEKTIEWLGKSITNQIISKFNEFNNKN